MRENAMHIIVYHRIIFTYKSTFHSRLCDNAWINNLFDCCKLFLDLRVQCKCIHVNWFQSQLGLFFPQQLVGTMAKGRSSAAVYTVCTVYTVYTHISPFICLLFFCFFFKFYLHPTDELFLCTLIINKTRSDLYAFGFCTHSSAHSVVRIAFSIQ